MSIEAMKQALDCLQAAYNLQQIDDLIPPHAPVKQAITSLRQAIANEALNRMAENARELGLDYEPVQAEKQEPVAWNLGVPPLYSEMKDGETISVEYTTPPAAPVQKPIEHLTAAFRALAPHCTMHDIARFREVCRNVLAIPPTAQREWVGLTDEEVWSACDGVDGSVPRYAKAIEAKLKEKNT